MNWKLSGGALMLAAALATACTTPAEEGDTASSESNISARGPLLAPTWATCWIEKDPSASSSFPVDALMCRYDAPAQEQPVRPKSMTVYVVDAVGNQVSAALHERAGEDVAVMPRLGDDRYPLRIQVVTLSDDFEKVGLETRVLQLSLSIATADAYRKDRPLALEQPFDLWPVTIIQKTSDYWLQLERRSLSLAPWRIENNPENTNTWIRALMVDHTAGDVATHYFVAPKEGDLTAKYFAGPNLDELAVRFSSGIYVAEASGLRKATDVETSAVPASADAGSSSPE